MTRGAGLARRTYLPGLHVVKVVPVPLGGIGRDYAVLRSQVASTLWCLAGHPRWLTARAPSMTVERWWRGSDSSRQNSLFEKEMFTGYITAPCARTDSNRHWTHFKWVVSYRLDYKRERQPMRVLPSLLLDENEAT